MGGGAPHWWGRDEVEPGSTNRYLALVHVVEPGPLPPANLFTNDGRPSSLLVAALKFESAVHKGVPLEKMWSKKQMPS